MLEIKDWFMRKQFSGYDIKVLRVLEETEKAIFADLYNSDKEEFFTGWLPKSVLETWDGTDVTEEIEKLKGRELLDKYLKELDEANGINEEDLPF